MEALSMATVRTLAALKAHRTRNEVAAKSARGQERADFKARVAELDGKINAILKPRRKPAKRAKVAKRAPAAAAAAEAKTA